jgi:aspartyl-tRNA synthetase
MGQRLGLRDKDTFSALWVVDFHRHHTSRKKAATRHAPPLHLT